MLKLSFDNVTAGRACLRSVLVALICLIPVTAKASSDDTRIILDVSSNGKLGTSWLKIIQDRHDGNSFERHKKALKPISENEKAWFESFKRVIPDWAKELSNLLVPFPGVTPPKPLFIVFGNQGGDDGFSFGTDRIGLDLSNWVSAYGSAEKAGNQDRIKRILSHEYTHLLTRAWMQSHPYPTATFRNSVLYELFHEGLGHYYSLNKTWVSPEGVLTSKATNTLKDLQPTFQENLRRILAGEDDPNLRKGMTSGPFASKWGALPIALWLSKETKRSPKELRNWVEKGPEGIIDLSQKYIDIELNPSITNLGPDFLKYWAEVKRLHLKQTDIAKHLELFQRFVIKDQKQFYLDVVFDKRKPGESFEFLLRKALVESLPIFESHEVEIQNNIKNFEEKTNKQISRLRSTVPGFQADFPIFGMVSLNKFVGAARVHKSKQLLAISMDKIAKYKRDFDMVFAHEAFHIYHKRVNPKLQEDLRNPKDALIAGAFIEGLATFIEGYLNPDRHHKRMAETLTCWCDRGEFAKYVGAFLADNDKLSEPNFSGQQDIYRKWFYTSREGDFPFPTETAYCIGDRVVTKLAKKHSPYEMARWRVAKLIKESKQTMKQWER